MTEPTTLRARFAARAHDLLRIFAPTAAVTLAAGLACAACCALPLLFAGSAAAGVLAIIEPHVAWVGLLAVGVVIAARARGREDASCATSCPVDRSCGCTLSDGALEARMDELRALFDDELVRVERRSAGELVWRFRGGHERVAALAARERECCAFLDMHVAAIDGEVHWILRGSAPALDVFESLPSGDRDAAVRALRRASAG
ncbi:hypothetical protein [Sandaracinus amylolyticus]|uniref:hypothetical protein n=1 Tax=Sandaracinus amylolyticus TaxID=927083 RepID=UPI001F38D5F2|nr:hypothetical protein [Sandaracinus amylolyticus]UJR79968.1 Hypothetical protein I5071_20100 [Sandaracinus amylolyticus]